MSGGQSRVHVGGGAPVPLTVTRAVAVLSGAFISVVLLSTLATLTIVELAAPAVYLSSNVAVAPTARVFSVFAGSQITGLEPVQENVGPEVCMAETNVAFAGCGSWIFTC